MKRKPVPASDPVIPKEILERATRTLDSDKPKKATIKCVVCGTVCSSTSPEQLCWVCRRLKISAWKDIEQQMPAQE